ncbi:MAG TPA: CDP-diacylglycerol diphosphatase [Alphaproteobacteria bacterium]|nr:CDP-diacylglycerol diphosphatase [Alphaproteobacteria bacterium]
MRFPVKLVLALFSLAALGPVPARAADPFALWKIVHDKCVPNEEAHQDSYPCTKVDLEGGVARGYVVLKDIEGRSQYLVLPTARVTGIESPLLLAPDAPNYFADAWHEIGRVGHALGAPLGIDELSLAVNSALGRSQNQLHIHLDCVRADVREILWKQLGAIGPHWAPLGAPLLGHRYLAMRVLAPDLDKIDPFKLLAQGIPAARASMDQWTLVVVGIMTDGYVPGFVILAGHVDPATDDWASGEELQDHDCALAEPAAEP